MSIGYASDRGLLSKVFNPTPYAGVPSQLPYTLPTSSGYTRPADWLTLTTAPNGGVTLLVAVFNTATNFISMGVTASTAAGFTVDWGDGTSPVNYPVGTDQTIAYNYSWSSISSGTLTSRGYRQAIITITPNTTNAGLSVFMFNKHASYTGTGVMDQPVLDIEINVQSGCFINSVGNSLNTYGYTTTNSPYLEQVKISGTPTSSVNSANFNGWARNCYALQNVIWNVSTPFTTTTSWDRSFNACSSLTYLGTIPATNVAGFNQCFQNCYLLKVAPEFTSTAITYCLQTFQNCRSLLAGPNWNLNAVQTCANMFDGCYNLRVVPNYDISGGSCASIASMFQNCYNLVTTPVFKTSTTVNYTAASMYSGCYNLTTINQMDWTRCTTFTSTFANCYSLVDFPALNAPNATAMDSMFSACYNLRTVGNINAPLNTNTSSMFINCYRLLAGPTFTSMAAVASLGSMYQNCFSLKSVPNMTIGGNGPGFASMFNACYSLLAAPSITISTAPGALTSMFTNCFSLRDASALTFTVGINSTISSMFQNCLSLQTAPNLGFPTTGVAGITANAMFSGCSSLITVPAYNLYGFISATGMFQNCWALTNAPAFTNTTSLTNVNNMFNGCASLQNIPAYNLTGVSSSTNLTNFATTCPNLQRVQVTNTRFTLSYANCNLAGAQLDEIYTNLPTITAQTITVSGNWGTATDTPSIATAKGWTVTGT